MSADEALQKIEKFKSSFKKNLEKNLIEFKKNINDIVSSVDKSKSEIKKTFQTSIEALKSSNTGLHEQELSNLEIFQSTLNQNLDEFISNRTEELGNLKGSFLENLNGLNLKLKDITTEKVNLVKETYQNILNSVENTFKQYVSDFLKNVKNSRENLTKELNDLEEQTFQNISKHFQNVNETYNENKDTLNALILMIFNEIKATSDANFQVVKEQVKFLETATVNQLKENNEVFIQYFRKLQTKYNTDLKNFTENMKNFFESVKKTKANYSNLLLDQIRTNIEVNEMQAFSKIIEAMRIFSEESNKQYLKYNQMIQENIQVSINKFLTELTSFNQESQNYFSTFLSAQADNIKELKITVEARLDEMIKIQNTLGEEFKVDYLSILMNQIKSYSESTEDFILNASESHEILKKELDAIEHVNAQTLDGFNERILNTEFKLNEILKKSFSVATDEAFKKEIKGTLEVIKEIRDYNENFQEHLVKNHEKNLKESQKNKDEINKLLMKNHKILEEGIADIQKNLDKRIDDFLKNFNSNIQDLKSKGDLFGNLDLQIQTFNSSIDSISDELFKIKDAYNKNLINILNELNEQNNTIIAEYDKLLKDQMVIFYNDYEKYMLSNIEGIKKVASDLISQNEIISPLKLPEVDKIFNKTIEIFEKYLEDSEIMNKKVIKENLAMNIKSNEELEGQMIQNIMQFEAEINTLFEINLSEHENLLNFFQKSYESQFIEFEDRLNQDLISLKNANQDNISKIMIKTAETGNAFFEQVNKTSKESKIIINDFLTTFNRTISDFSNNFNNTIEEVKDIILSKISEDNDLLFREHYDLPPILQNEYEINFHNFQGIVDEFLKEHQFQLDKFKNDSIELLKHKIQNHLVSIIKNINESEQIKEFLSTTLNELDRNVKEYSIILENSIADLKKIFKKLSEKDSEIDSIIDSI
ncbi:MAG: hypothetical protein EAX96_07165 [Candidatus Lokiarchaeota archaeon]|nr:hypothetical protein [Candidatus Lokiarchaeota archaeon]